MAEVVKMPRVCYACKRVEPVSGFAPDASKAGGFKSICRECDNVKSRRYHAANRERAIAWRRNLDPAIRKEYQDRARKRRELHYLEHPRLCVICKRPAASSRHWYCVECGERQRFLRNDRPSTTTSKDRGYDANHRRLRRIWKRLVDAGGIRCARGADCVYAELVDGVKIGGLIRPGAPWDLDHDDVDRTQYLGPSHQKCNRATANRVRHLGGSRAW